MLQNLLQKGSISISPYLKTSWDTTLTRRA